MMIVRPLSRAEVRSIDEIAARDYAMPTIVLMENAGRGAAECLKLGCPPGGRVLVVCGPGNNGGDGGVVARFLDLWGYSVRVVWTTEAGSIHGDAGLQREIVTRSGIAQEFRPEGLPADLFEGIDWVVDALFGTGLDRPLEGVFLETVEAMNASGRPVLAIDLPSGLDADTGRPLGAAVRARLTATFVAPKIGFSAEWATACTGEVRTVDIGVPRALLEPFRAITQG